jgi:hypothetical protein
MNRFFAKRVPADFLEQFELGVQSLEKGNNLEAINFFKQAHALYPGGDAASKLWRKECEQALAEGLAVGVKEMNK